MTIKPIVEGHGDVSAVPVLLRRLCAELMTAACSGTGWPVILRAIRRPRGKLAQPDGVRQAVELALLDAPDAVLVTLDSDDDCPAELGPRLQSVAAEAARGVPCRVVLAHREYEAWILAAAESLRGRAGVRPDADAHPQPEAPRDAKAEIESRMFGGRSYHETDDQARMTSMFDMELAYRRCRSFRQMAEACHGLLVECGLQPKGWVPK